MAQHPPILNDASGFIHGCDANPEQWLPQSETVLQKDIALVHKVGINTPSVMILTHQ